MWPSILHGLFGIMLVSKLVETGDGEILRYSSIAIIEDKIPDNQKVTKMWKTLVHHVEYLSNEGK